MNEQTNRGGFITSLVDAITFLSASLTLYSSKQLIACKHVNIGEHGNKCLLHISMLVLNLI